MTLIPLPTKEDESLKHTPIPSPFPVLTASHRQTAQSIAMPQANMSAEEQRMQELERMLQEAQGRAEVMEREAYDKAYAAGEKAGMALGEKRAEQSLQYLAKLMIQAEAELAGLERDCTNVVVDLAHAVMTHVLGDEKEQWHDILMAAIERASIQFPEIKGLTLQLHPDDMDVISSLISPDKTDDWRLKADASIDVGTCRLMSSQQDVYINPKQAIEDVLKQLKSNLTKVTDTTTVL